MFYSYCGCPRSKFKEKGSCTAKQFSFFDDLNIWKEWLWEDANMPITDCTQNIGNFKGEINHFYSYIKENYPQRENVTVVRPV